MTLRDGGRVALDWTIADFATNEFTPILLILPGLTGTVFLHAVYFVQMNWVLDKVRLHTVERKIFTE